MVMTRMRTGFAVIGDTQQLPGYCVLLCDNGSINHLTDLPRDERAGFLLDRSLLGEAVEKVCRLNGLRRINYEVLGNSMDVLHGHVHARYDREPADKIGGPVGATRSTSAAATPTPTTSSATASSGLKSRGKRRASWPRLIRRLADLAPIPT
jgi:diadenosine tetraphosphate (Ap4A) HIT family hydrolase